MTEKRIQAILFDFDDTLIDWSGRTVDFGMLEQEKLNGVRDYMVERGFAMPPLKRFLEVYQRLLQASWTEAKKTWSGVSFKIVLQLTFKQIGIDTAALDFDEIQRVYNWNPVPGVAPYPDTLPVLQQLRDAGLKIGLITNSMWPMWMRDVELEHFGILDYLDVRLTSGDTGYMKPHPFIYWQALEAIDVPARHALFVGDRPANDIAGANEAGLTSVLLDPPHLDYPLEGVKPDFTIKRLRELIPIIRRLEGDVA